MLPIAGSRTVALHGVTPVPCASIQGRAIAISTATQAAATIAPSPRWAVSLATRTRQRAEERRDGGPVAELPRGADGAQGDEQEQEVAAGAEDVAHAGRGVEAGGRVAEREARVEGGEGEDRGEEAVGRRRARRLTGFAGEESARAG